MSLDWPCFVRGCFKSLSSVGADLGQDLAQRLAVSARAWLGGGMEGAWEGRPACGAVCWM